MLIYESWDNNQTKLNQDKEYFHIQREAFHNDKKVNSSRRNTNPKYTLNITSKYSMEKLIDIKGETEKSESIS